jgi:hypothetical protein
MRLSKLIIPVVGFVAIGVIVAMTSQKEQRIEKQNRNWCVQEYGKLEYQFQKAKGFFNDDEEKIAKIKTLALQLKEEGCDRYTGGAVSRLIAKCNDELK